MWIFMNDSFLSIVAHRERKDLLLVRARKKGDIERIFPESNPVHTPDADYRYRALVTREAVAAAVASRLETISYSNFKESVRDERRHFRYFRVWNEMFDFE